jgi:uncharacterized protein (TIGR00369 family)
MAEDNSGAGKRPALAGLPLLEDDGYCFVCGGDNPQGLRLAWQTDGRQATAQFTPQRVHQGWRGVVHGGLLAALLDEAMTRLVWQRAGAAVTAEMTVRYLAPARTGEPLVIRGEVLDESKRLVLARAEITGPNGTVVARAEGKTLKLSGPASKRS